MYHEQKLNEYEKKHSKIRGKKFQQRGLSTKAEGSSMLARRVSFVDQITQNKLKRESVLLQAEQIQRLQEHKAKAKSNAIKQLELRHKGMIDKYQ